MPGCEWVAESMPSCFRARAAPAPADAARWFERCLPTPASWRGPPTWRASIASMSWLLRIRPAPGMARVCAMRCNSGMSIEERPVPPRLRDLDVDAVAPAAAGASSDADGAPLRISVVSLTNGPSMIFGRLGEPARPVDPVQRHRGQVDARCFCMPPDSAIARKMSRKAPGRQGRPHPSYRRESEAPCAKDLGYGNNTVP